MDGPSGLDLARDKMRDAGVPDVAIKVFEHGYHLLEEGATGILPESDVEPLTDVAHAEDLDAEGDDDAREALGRTALIKLNGGLGTSMGMDRAKSLLPVRGDLTFLDVIARQVLAARETYGVRLPLVLMNSFRTRDDSLAALERYPDLAVDGVPQDFLQNREPKLLADDLTPVEWRADPELEWCPPGHGDLYTALQTSGVLEALRAAGFRYAAVSNADNLGSAPSAAMAGWFASTGAGFGAEVARRTPADRKEVTSWCGRRTTGSSCARRPRLRTTTRTLRPTSAGTSTSTRTTSGSTSTGSPRSSTSTTASSRSR
ncbi:hypothetical protein GCM10025864_37640 [Luteimicrobium album]|uniref:UTP--glucose-1-phosphate uridylyltransferase n=1 Tax=Luteimicrobium album TaxID=1054550 RepID=A0ABQ6I5H7_9MICO|nr:hypothetical protein GCM10025864_37640 [Luteimicrobium album]